MNIVTLVTHDTGRFLPCYGVNTLRTPHIDRMASEGIVFENAFCTAPQCCPARASLFTGLTNHRTGVVGLIGKKFGWSFHPERPHLASRLSQAGYDTAAFGIIHEIGNTQSDPKDLYHAQGFHHLRGWGDGCEPGVSVCKGFADWLQERSAGSDGRPFYAQIGIFETHRNYNFANCTPDDSLGVTIPKPLLDGPATREDFAVLQNYIAHVDEAIGVVLHALDRTGHAEDTLLVLTTDHGMEIPRGKGTLYDLGLEALMLMRGPGIADGVRYPHLHSHTDFVPTLLEILGLPADNELDGVSHWQALRRPTESVAPRDYHFAAKTMHTQYDPMRSVRTSRWKYIRNFEATVPEQCCTDCNHGAMFEEQVPVLRLIPNPPEELYDLEADPGELQNLAEIGDYTAIKLDLEQRLAHHMAETRDPLLEGPIATPVFHEARRRMVALGAQSATHSS
jgi:N-sulfoglucosamine sulfohydrolase